MRGRFQQLFACSAVVVIALSVRTFGQDMSFQLDPAQSTVTFTLGDVLHTVHGTFRLKSGQVLFNPTTGVAGGELVVDATSGNSGSAARDKKMHKDILESQKYPEITFLPKQVKGPFVPGQTSSLVLLGTMTLHGQPHDMQVSFPVHSDRSETVADVNFVVPYVKWGLKNPSTFILRVEDHVEIAVHAVGRVSTGTAAAVSR